MTSASVAATNAVVQTALKCRLEVVRAVGCARHSSTSPPSDHELAFLLALDSFGSLPVALLALAPLPTPRPTLFQRSLKGGKGGRGDHGGKIRLDEDNSTACRQMSEVLAATAKVLIH